MSSIWYDKKNIHGHRICRYLFEHWCMKCGCGNRPADKDVSGLDMACQVTDDVYLADFTEKILIENPERASSHIELVKRMFLDEDTKSGTRFYADFSKRNTKEQ